MEVIIWCRDWISLGLWGQKMTLQGHFQPLKAIFLHMTVAESKVVKDRRMGSYTRSIGPKWT